MINGGSLLTPRRVSRTRKDVIVVHRWGLLKEGRLIDEYLAKDHPAMRLGLISDPVDVVSFPERAFSDGSSRYSFPSRTEVLGLLRLTTCEDWFCALRKKQRYTLRRAKKLGVEARLSMGDEEDVQAAYSLYHETDRRQDMKFVPYYSYSASALRSMLAKSDSCIMLGAYLNKKLVGFMKLRIGELGAIVETMLVTIHRIPGVGNVLIESAVKELCAKDIRFLIYGHMGYMSGLDDFKIHNGFKSVPDRRYYVPMTHKGRVCINMGLCSEPWELMPRQLWNWAYSLRGVLSRFFVFNPTPDDRHLMKTLSPPLPKNSHMRTRSL